MTHGPSPLLNFLRSKLRDMATRHPAQESLHTCTIRKIVGQYHLIIIYLDLNNLLSLSLTNLSALYILNLLMTSPYLLLI